MIEYENRRIDARDIARPVDPRLAEYATRVGQDPAELARAGVTVVACTCRMTGCPGWTAKWPHDDS
jgi:hypothetical protein